VSFLGLILFHEPIQNLSQSHVVIEQVRGGTQANQTTEINRGGNFINNPDATSRGSVPDRVNRGSDHSGSGSAVAGEDDYSDNNNGKPWGEKEVCLTSDQPENKTGLTNGLTRI
jgi:hypothetical protein